MMTLLVSELGKGASPREEWTAPDDADCLNCPAFHADVRREEHDGCALVTSLVALSAGFVVGLLVGMAVWK